MRLPNTTWYAAHSSNYTKGRSSPITDFTVHHTAANNTTLRHLWGDASRNGSSTLFVSASVREQYVSLNDTPWTNSNFASNSRSITCEVSGDWRNGYHNQKALNNLTEVMYQSLKLYPHLKLTYHMDVTDKGRSTLCPADLKHKGYALDCWKKAKARIAKENAPAPAPKPKITYKKITPKRVELKQTANLWDFNFTSWDKAKAVKSFSKGHVVDVVAAATNSLGAKYYMTAYSYNEGKVRATNGFNTADTKAVSTSPPPTPPKEPEPEPKPIDTDPDEPGESDVEKRLSAVEALLNKVVDFLSSIFSNFKKD